MNVEDKVPFGKSACGYKTKNRVSFGLRRAAKDRRLSFIASCCKVESFLCWSCFRIINAAPWILHYLHLTDDMLLPSRSLLWHSFSFLMFNVFIFKTHTLVCSCISLPAFRCKTVREVVREHLPTFTFPSLTQEEHFFSLHPPSKKLSTCRNIQCNAAYLALCLQPSTMMLVCSFLLKVMLNGRGPDQCNSEVVSEGWLNTWWEVLPFTWERYYCTLWHHKG